jgi:hypothetical protein
LSASASFPAQPQASVSTSAGSGIHSPTISQASIFAAAGSHPSPYTTATGLGVYYHPVRMATANDFPLALVNSDWVNANDIAVTNSSYNNRGVTGDNDNDDDREDRGSSSDISSSSVMTDSPSPLDLNSIDDSSSDTQSNVADNADDTSSEYFSDSDSDNATDDMASRAANGELGDDIDHETHLASGDIVKDDGEIIPIGPRTSKPKFEFKKLQKSTVVSMLPEFLAQIEASNQQLQAEIAAGKNVTIEAAEDSEQYIEMNLGLGVLEEQNDATSDADSESSDSSTGDIMEKLMGGKRKRDARFQDEKVPEKAPIKRAKIEELSESESFDTAPIQHVSLKRKTKIVEVSEVRSSPEPANDHLKTPILAAQTEHAMMTSTPKKSPASQSDYPILDSPHSSEDYDEYKYLMDKADAEYAEALEAEDEIAFSATHAKNAASLEDQDDDSAY